MKKVKELNLTNHKIWKDKNIKPEAKEIYCYLYVKGFDNNIININIGSIQKEFKSIRNLAFRKNLQQLENTIILSLLNMLMDSTNITFARIE